jgi:hypothetical protein
MKHALQATLVGLTLSITPLALASAASAAPPADGTVGRADAKAPNGQSPEDHNRGYECDDNPGVGNGNPAHTSICVTDPGGGSGDT